MRSAVIAYERECDVRKAKLAETAPEVLSEFQGELNSMAQKIRARGSTVQAGGKDWLGRRLPSTSNHPTIVRVLDAIRDAREATDAIKLEGLDAGEVAAKIAALRDSIAKAGEE